MDHNYIFELLKDDPDNIKRIDEALYDIKRSMYSNAYNAQRAISIFHRIDIPFSAHRKVKGNRIAFDLNYTYVEAKGRNAFRKSKYYKQEVYSSELFKNPDTFSKGVIVFIDGKLTTNFYVYMNEDITEIRFAKYFTQSQNVYEDGFWSGAIESMADNGSILSVVIIPMCKHSYAKTSVGTLTDNNLTISMMDEYLEASSYVNSGNVPMLFIAEEQRNTFSNGLFCNSIAFENENGNMKLPSNIFDGLQRSNRIHVNIFTPANLFMIKTVPNDGWFELPIMKMPIPLEQLLVFTKTEKDGNYVLSTIPVEMFYPNKYHINNEDYDGEYLVYVFYNNDIDSTVLAHTNELSLYTTFVDSLPLYGEHKVPMYIREYTPVSTEYNIENYIDSGIHSLEYKIEKLRTVIKENPALYKYYLNRYVEYYPNTFVVVDEDMYNSRIRTDTSNEFPDNVVTFDEERFYFSMRKENNAQAFRMFIDNKCYISPDGISWAFEDENFIHYYIPATEVKVGSYIEVQKLNNTAMKESYVVDTSKPTRILIDDIYHMKADDIYITYNDGTDDLYVNGYTLYEKVNDTRAVEDTDVVIGADRYKPAVLFNKYNELYIIWDDDTYNGKTVTVRSDKYYIAFGNIGTETIVASNDIMDNDRRHFMIFRNGRLMAPNGFNPRYNRDYANGPHSIHTLVIGGDDVKIDLEHLPDKYDLVVDYHDDYVKRLRIYQKYLDNNIDIEDRDGNIYDKQIEASMTLENAIEEAGHFLDLTNMITKPLDFRWYDIYMNGLKLTERDVKFISPYQMLITLKDDYPDIDTFIIIDMLGFIEKYVLPLPFINPDWQQVSDEAVKEFPDVVDENENVIFDGDNNFAITRSILLNPNAYDGFVME